MNSLRLLIILTALVVAEIRALAQPQLSIQEAVETALRSHPLLSALDARTGSAQGQLVQAGLRPNPRLFVQTENWRFSGAPALKVNQDIDTYAYVTKPVETAGKRERRMEVARAGVERSRLDRDVLARQIALRVRQAYWSASAAGKLHRLLIENARNFQQIVDFHEIRVRAGVIAEADLIKVRLEQDRLQLSIQTAALEAERARLQLFREMAFTPEGPVTLSEIPEDISAPPAGDPASAIASRPEIASARKALEQARLNLRLQRANARPDVDILGGYKRTAGFDTVLGGVQINLPWTNRNQGNIASADSEIRAAEFELRSLERSVIHEVLSAQAEVRTRAEQLRKFAGGSGDGLRARSAQSLQIALAAYREGGTDLLRLLDAQRLEIDTQVLYYRTLTEYRLSVVALESALGVNP